MKTTKKISNEDLEWLHKYRQNVEHRNKSLKSIGVFTCYFVFSFALVVTFFAVLSFFTTTEFAAYALVVVASAEFSFAISLNKYNKEGFIGIINGLILGAAIALIYLAPIL